MCGRYRLSRRKQALDEYFAAEPSDVEWNPRYNIAPTQPIVTVRQDSKRPARTLSLMRWGLIPSWAKDASMAASMINARSETVTIKPAFKDALKLRRCLIPADGFYEWQRERKSRQPFCFEVNDGELFAFAGLWDRWVNPSGEIVESCSILTTTANSLTRDVHDRMPVILAKDDYDLWLDPGMNNSKGACELLKPLAASQMRKYAVSTRINTVQNDDESCAAPVEPYAGPVQQSLL